MAELAAQPAVALPALPAGLSVTVEDRSIVGIAARRGAMPALQEAVRAIRGVALPVQPRRVAADGLAFIWAGAEKWLAVGDGVDDRLLPSCRAAFGVHAALVELGDGRCVFRIEGSAARDVLARLLPIDLHPRAFPPDGTALTLAGHVHVQVWQLGGAPRYELAVARSFADDVVHQLAGAAGFSRDDVASVG